MNKLTREEFDKLGLGDRITYLATIDPVFKKGLEESIERFIRKWIAVSGFEDIKVMLEYNIKTGKLLHVV